MVTTAATEPKRRRSREETRQRLVDAALDVFARNGYERATVDEIVRDAGFSKGAFYVHFESKDDLFWQLLEERIEAQQETFRAVLDPADSVVENERRVLEALFAGYSDERLSPAIFLEFAAHGMRNEKVRERLGEMYARWHAFVVETLQQGQSDGHVRTDFDVSLLASALIALFEGTMIQSRLAPKELRLNTQIEPLSRLLADWLAARA